MKNYESHVRRLQEMSSVVDTSKPTSKKLPSTRISEQRRLREEYITQENCNLLDRLAKVMQKKRIDNDGERYLKHRVQTKNATTKKHELQRITEENKRLLRRIQQVNPVYDHLEFENTAKKNEYLAKKMSDHKDVRLPPQIETWLSEKHRLVKSARGLTGDTVSKRKEYAPVATSSMRRSKSATVTRPMTWRNSECESDVIDDLSKEKADDEKMLISRHIEERPLNIEKKKKKKSKKKKGRGNSLQDKEGSPLRGRIRPKSGRI